MSYDLLFKQAIELHQNGRFDEAEPIYRQILETAPEHPDVLNLLGLIAQIKGINSQAANLFYRAIKSSPNHPPFHFNLGVSLYNWNKPREALESFNKAINLDPSIKEAELFIGLIHKDLGEIEKSRQHYLRAIELDPDYSEAKTRLAISYYPQNTPKALADLSEITANYPQDPLAPYFLSIINFDLQDFDNAKKYAQIANNISPDNDDILSQLGQTELKQNNPSQAYQYFSKAIKINPRNLDALVNLANLEMQQNNLNLAEDYYKSAIEFSPNHIDARLNYANLLHQQKRLSEALDEYRQVIILNPKIAEASNNLGVILKETGEIAEALGLFFNAFALKPEIEEISTNLAETLILFHQTSPQDAVKIAQNWVKNAPQNTFAQHTLASLTGENEIDSTQYAQKLFDNFSLNYEETLKKLDYNLPSKIKDILGEINGQILDLGCGSGLIGQKLKNHQNEITGVDISSKMLTLAKQKNVYKNLIKSDILDFLRTTNQKFSLIIAADVFCYIGNLEPIISACNQTRLCFSVELLPKPQSTKFSLMAASNILRNML